MKEELFVEFFLGVWRGGGGEEIGVCLIKDKENIK